MFGETRFSKLKGMQWRKCSAYTKPIRNWIHTFKMWTNAQVAFLVNKTKNKVLYSTHSNCKNKNTKTLLRNTATLDTGEQR